MQPEVGSIWRDKMHDVCVRVVGLNPPGWVRVTFCAEDGYPSPNKRRYSKHEDLFGTRYLQCPPK